MFIHYRYYGDGPKSLFWVWPLVGPVFLSTCYISPVCALATSSPVCFKLSSSASFPISIFLQFLFASRLVPQLQTFVTALIFPFPVQPLPSQANSPPSATRQSSFFFPLALCFIQALTASCVNCLLISLACLPLACSRSVNFTCFCQRDLPKLILNHIALLLKNLQWPLSVGENVNSFD